MGLTYGRRRVWVRYGGVVDSSSLFVPTLLFHLVWQPFTGQDYVTSFLHTDCSVPSSEFDLSIDYLRFSPLFIVPKEIQFSEFIIARIYIYIVVPISAIRKSDFLKNRFKVVKFLNTRKVFHLFVALPPIPTIGW